MNKTQEALKLALEALESVKHKIDSYQVNVCDDVDEAITAIREALAEQPAQKRPQNCGTGYCSCIECVMEQPAQQQEPVAWITQNGKGWLRWHKPEDNNTDSVPLYTSPPASKPWVGLTDEEIQKEFHPLHATGLQFASAIEAKLREKNA